MHGIQRNMWLWAFSMVVLGCIAVSIIDLYATDHLMAIMAR